MSDFKANMHQNRLKLLAGMGTPIFKGMGGNGKWGRDGKGQKKMEGNGREMRERKEKKRGGTVLALLFPHSSQ